MILRKDKEDTALLLGGKKMNFNKGYFDRLGSVLNLNNKQINAVYKRFVKWLPEAFQLIERSFLTDDYKNSYKALITQRVGKLTTTKENVKT